MRRTDVGTAGMGTSFAGWRMAACRAAAWRLSSWREQGAALARRAAAWPAAQQQRARLALSTPGDAARGIGTLAAALLAGLRRAGGETHLVLVFIAALTLLTAWPKPDPHALPEVELRPAQAARLEPSATLEAPYAREPWKPVRPDLAAYALQAAELGGAGVARIRAMPGGVRQDLLVFADETAPISGGVFVERIGLADRLGETLYVDAARRAAVLGASIERLDQSTTIASKFGSVEAADAQIILNGRQSACLVFRLLGEGPVGIAGLFCGMPALPMDRTRLTCLIDRLDLIGAGDDRALRQYFASAERARTGCSRAPATRSPGLNRVVFDGARIRG